MDTCGRLTRGNNYYAWFDAEHKHLIISADIEVNPYASDGHICPNPLSKILPAPDMREFLLELTERNHGPIIPQIMVVKRVQGVFNMDAQPKSVRLFFMGVDNPASQELEVKTVPPPALVRPAAAATTTPGAPAAPVAKKGTSVTVTGFSQQFSFEEALQDGLRQLAEKLPFHNPDIAIQAHVDSIDARSGGNIIPGVFVKITGRV